MHAISGMRAILLLFVLLQLVHIADSCLPHNKVDTADVSACFIAELLQLVGVLASQQSRYSL